MKTYLRFLVAELLFTRDKLIYHDIPFAEANYNELFKELEDRFFELNLLIRMTRRRLEIVDEVKDFFEMEKIIEDEFQHAFKEESRRICDMVKFSDMELKNFEDMGDCEDIYRDFLYNFSPVLNELSDEDLKFYEKLKEAFIDYDIDFLKSVKNRYLEEKKKKPYTEEQLIRLKEEISAEILEKYDEFPLNTQELMKDPQAISHNLDRLQDTIDEYEVLFSTLEEELNLKIARRDFQY